MRKSITRPVTLEKQIPQETEHEKTVCDEQTKEIEDKLLELYVKGTLSVQGRISVGIYG